MNCKHKGKGKNYKSIYKKWTMKLKKTLEIRKTPYIYESVEINII